MMRVCVGTLAVVAALVGAPLDVRADVVERVVAVVNDDATHCKTSGTEVRIEWSPQPDGRWPFDRAVTDYLRPKFRLLIESLVAGFAGKVRELFG